MMHTLPRDTHTHTHTRTDMTWLVRERWWWDDPITTSCGGCNASLAQYSTKSTAN